MSGGRHALDPELDVWTNSDRWAAFLILSVLGGFMLGTLAGATFFAATL